MDEAVRQEFNRSYEIMNERDEKRSKEIAENNTQIALLIANQQRCSEDLKLAIKNMHGAPCRDHLDLKATVSEHLKKHADELKTTVDVERTNRRDWRMIALRWIERIAVVGVTYGWLKLSALIDAIKHTGNQP